MVADELYEQEARQVLMDNDRGSFSIPTQGLYPFQWNWDSGFAALGYASFDLDRAWTELETLFSGQWPNGMVPHILFHEDSSDYFPGPEVWGRTSGPIPSSGITQPPVAPTIAKMIWEKDRDFGRDRIRTLLPKMLRWHQWFMNSRLNEEVIVATHPWESGRDNSPDWDDALTTLKIEDVPAYTRKDTSRVDPSMRPTQEEYDKYLWLVHLGRKANWVESELEAKNPFRVGDPGLTFIVLRAARDLAALSLEFGHDIGGLKEDIARLEDGLNFLWNPDLNAYTARSVKTKAFADSITSASFLCWYGGVDSKTMHVHLRHVLEEVHYVIPSLDSRSPKFDRSRYWRGPTWAIMNFMIAKGLHEHAYPEAARLLKATRAMIKKGGFAEYFDPYTGGPKGGMHFTWTAAVWLFWAGR